MHANTMHGLQHWYKSTFEKLGWMVLAKEKGYDFKIVTYKRSIQHLLKSIDHVSSEYKDADRKHDLNVLKMNTECLWAFVQRSL